MDITSIIQTVGYVGIFAIIFAESGLLLGFFLPGDSLLFTAGILASRGVLNIYWLLPTLFIAAVLGVNAGYFIGKRYGGMIFSNPNSILFTEGRLEKSKNFYSKHGGKTVILARFTPIVRSIAPILAGVAEMNFKPFMFFNIVGAALWVFTITLLGYFLGNNVHGIDKYILPLLAVLMLASFLPPLVRIWRDAEQREKLLARLRRKPKKVAR